MEAWKGVTGAMVKRWNRLQAKNKKNMGRRFKSLRFGKNRGVNPKLKN